MKLFTTTISIFLLWDEIERKRNLLGIFFFFLINLNLYSIDAEIFSDNPWSCCVYYSTHTKYATNEFKFGLGERHEKSKEKQQKILTKNITDFYIGVRKAVTIYVKKKKKKNRFTVKTKRKTQRPFINKLVSIRAYRVFLMKMKIRQNVKLICRNDLRPCGFFLFFFFMLFILSKKNFWAKIVSDQSIIATFTVFLRIIFSRLFSFFSLEII